MVIIGALAVPATSTEFQSASLSLSTGAGTPGGTVTLDVSLNPGTGPAPASVQWDLTYSASDLSPVAGIYYATGAAGSGAGKSVDCNSMSSGDIRCIVFGASTTAIGNGVIATLTFQIASGTTDTSTAVSVTNLAASDGNANALGITGTGGTVTINQSTTPVLSSLSCSPASVTPPATSTCTVSLSGAASSTTTINLSSGAAAATVPSSVNIASGLSSTTFTVTTTAVSSSTPAEITAKLGSNSENFTVTLTAPTCSYSLSANSSNFNSSAGSGSFNVVDSSGCSWSVTNNSTFITITAGGSGTANGTVNYSIPANIGAARSGTLTVGGQMFTVNQAAPGVPATVSVTPSSGSGLSQTFTLQYSDTSGAANLQYAWVYFTASLANPDSQSCLVYYNVAPNRVNLMNDAGTAFTSATPGASGTLTNSQCSLNVTATTVTKSGNTLTLKLAMTFAAAYAGAKNIYMYASDASGASVGWQQEGAWTVLAAAGTPAAVSASPSSGSGLSQTFTLQYSDTAGAANLQYAWVYFTASLANPDSQSCLLYYNVAPNQISLMNDAGTAWLTATPGTASTTLSNSQCSLNVTAMTVTPNGNALTLKLPMTFEAGYAGAKNTYMYASDLSGASSGWQQEGSWTILAVAGIPANVSVAPSSGSGLSQTYKLQYSDTAGAANLQYAWVYFTASLANPDSQSCLLYYNVAPNQINLLNDAGTAWLSATPGTPSTTLSNSQCSLNVAAMTVTPNGNTLTLKLPMTFKAAYAGAKNTYMYASDLSGANSGWQQEGTWTVP